MNKKITINRQFEMDGPSTLIEAGYLDLAADFFETRSASWTTSFTDFEKYVDSSLLDIRIFHYSGRQVTLLATIPSADKGAVIQVKRATDSVIAHTAVIKMAFYPQSNQLHVGIAAARGATAGILADIKKNLPALVVPDPQVVPVQFVTISPTGGARSYERQLHVPPWDEIAGNYSHSAGDALSRLMNKTYDPERDGQLILWHGPPGTGKTYALRSLMWEWKDFARGHYIIDPDAYFMNASYMVDVILETDEDGPEWKLLIFEDTGELIVPTAKQETGQGLSRLLNMVDGLIGQGLKIITLITTNEDVGKMHPAVKRPGRCGADIEFGELTPTEAEKWLADRGVSDVTVGSAKSLAQLYEMIGRERIVARKNRIMGF